VSHLGARVRLVATPLSSMPPGRAGDRQRPPLEPVVLKPGQAPWGRMAVEGRVISVKVTESERWGSRYRMAVRLRNGVVVWSSVPRSLDEAVELEPQALQGRWVSFTATFEASERDPHFAFARRPRDAGLGSTIENSQKANRTERRSWAGSAMDPERENCALRQDRGKIVRRSNESGAEPSVYLERPASTVDTCAGEGLGGRSR
jgi:hypothetical protein